MNHKKNKLIFVFRGLGIGGAEKILMFVANKCVDLGHDVLIIALTNNNKTLEMNQKIRIEVMEYDSNFINKSSFFNRVIQKIILLWKLRRRIKKEQPDLVITFMADLVRIVSISCKGLKIPIIGSERSNPFGYSDKQFSKYSKAYEKCDALVFQTEKASSIFNNNIRNKAYIISNPCIPRLTDIRPYIGERRKVIVAAGRLETQKRFDVLIYSFKEIINEFPNYQLHIYGEGTQRSVLERIISENNLKNYVILKGDSKDVFAEAHDCSFFVLSSDFEGIPNILIEALSIGLPCISTDCSPGGPRMLLDDGRRGLLITPGSTSELSAAMKKYILNPELASRKAVLGLEIKDELSPEKISEKWMNVFAETITKYKGT